MAEVRVACSSLTRKGPSSGRRLSTRLLVGPLLAHAKCDKVFQGLQLLVVDEVEFLYEVNEVLEAVIEVRIGFLLDHLFVVSVEDVGVDAEEAFVNNSHALSVCHREGNA